MSIASKLIEQVVAGKHSRDVLTLREESAPAWKIGQPVPEGHKVVFGKLVKSSDVPTGRMHTHNASTAAYKTSAKASGAQSHLHAAAMHYKAAAMHRRAELNSRDDFDKSEHSYAADKHMDHADSHHEKSGYEGHRGSKDD